jgi:hypothetical protein
MNQKLAWAGVLLCALSAAAWAETAAEKELKEDVANHRLMATSHEAAAKCLEAGKPDDVCEAQLEAACKGLGIGKHCGMKHVHK